MVFHYSQQIQMAFIRSVHSVIMVWVIRDPEKTRCAF